MPDFLIEFGFMERGNLKARRAWIAGYGAIVPAGCLFYVWLPDPVMLLSVGALMGVLLLPVQSGATLWLQRNNMDVRVRPSAQTRAGLWLIFAFQLVMAALLAWYIVVGL